MLVRMRVNFIIHTVQVQRYGDYSFTLADWIFDDAVVTK